MSNADNNSWAQYAIYGSLALALVMLGIYLSDIRYLGSEWLSRAGCLIVVLGIWSSVGSILQERLLASRIRWRRRLAMTKLRARHMDQGIDAEQAQEEIAATDEAFAKTLADSTHSLRLSLGALEVALLITGTLLWGFGDLLAAAL